MGEKITKYLGKNEQNGHSKFLPINNCFKKIDYIFNQKM